MKKPKAILFDLDGTLLDSIDVSYGGVKKIFAMSNLSAPDFLEYCEHYIPPFMDFYRDRGVTAPKEELFDWYHSVATHHNALLFPDSVETIQTLHQRGILLGVISAQRQDVLDAHCQRAGIDRLFDSIVGFSEQKSVDIKKFLLKHNLSSKEVWYVGDFPFDMMQAKKADVRAIGITRNYDTGMILQAAGADLCIKHLDELSRLVASLEK